LGRRAAVGLALHGQRVAELTHRAGRVPARVGLAQAGHATLARRALVGDAEVLAGAAVAVFAGVAGDAEARVALALAAHADLRGRAGQLRVVAVDAAAGDAGLRRHAGDAGAEVDALAGVLVAALARRAGDALAALRDAELVHALVSGR